VTEEEEELLWSRQVLCGDTALNLNLTVFYLISEQFDTCGYQEHHHLRVEHLNFIKTLVLVSLSMLSGLKDLQKQGKQGLYGDLSQNDHIIYFPFHHSIFQFSDYRHPLSEGKLAQAYIRFKNSSSYLLK